jgi:hypothetical protein
MPLPLPARSASCAWSVLVATTLLVTAGSTWSQEGRKEPNAVALTNLPVSFEPNQGQAEPPARFVVRTRDLNVALRPLGMDLLLGNRKGEGSRLGLQFVGADPNADLVASDARASYSNYILGSVPSRWLSHVPNFGRVAYNRIYPGVDVLFYGNGRQLEHDFVVAPGADYRLIRIRIDGPEQIELQTDGSLKLAFPGGDLIFEKPVVYQFVAGTKRVRQGHFVLLGKREFGFAVGDYDRTKTLIIDPVLSYSTYLADLSLDVAGVATDAAGDTFLTGLVFSSNFPVTPGAYQPTCKSCGSSNVAPDVFITKINASGTGLVYSTFLGGTDYDQPFGIAVDAAGNAVVVGRTQSTDFPVKNPIGVGSSGNGSFYGFISSLSADGSKLNYSSVLGGGAQPFQSSTTLVGGVALDTSGNAYISGTTDSPVFPTTVGALHMVTPGYPNNVVFVSKFLTTGSLGYSALLGDTSPQNGGGGQIGVFGVAADAAGSAYITGTSGTLWPTTSGAFQTTIPGATPYATTFVTKLSPDASSLAYSTFLGDGGASTAITVKSSTGEAFVTGNYAGNSTTGNNFPTTPNAYEKTIGKNGCCASYFTELSADGSKLLYSSYFSGDLTASPSFTYTTSIALDGADNIWLSGTTTSPQLPLKYPLQSLPATLTNFPSTTTGFLSRFDAAGANLTFSSYFGGLVQGGRIAGVAIDAHNKAHIAGTTGDGLFTTPGAYLSSVTPPPPSSQYIYGYAAVIDADTPAPSVCFDSQGLLYGYVGVGASLTQTLTVTNCGNASLTISSVRSSNPRFTIPTASNTCQQSVAANASCTIGVVFTPTAVGDVSGTLTIASNAPVPGTSLPIEGMGTVPQISLQTTTVTFDPQFIGQTSPRQFVLIGNNGGVPLTIDLAHTKVSAGFTSTQSGCDQPIYQGGNCFLLLTFTPAAAGTLTGTLTIASNDPKNPTVSVGLSGTGYSSYPVPTLTFLSLPTIQAGSAPVSLQIYGTNFFPASVVRVGGTARPTTYQSSTNISATLDASLIATFGELPVTVLNPSPGGGETAPSMITVYQSIPLAARAMVYDPFSRLLFAAVEAGATNNPNTVAVIDPVAGKVSQYISVGKDPRKLALSDDGQYLYVSLDADHAIQRINLRIRTVEKTFALPVDPSFGVLTVADMKVVPGSPKAVVAAFFRVASPAEDGIALFNDGGLVNWLIDSFLDSVDTLAFAGHPPVVYTLPDAFTSFTIDGKGIHLGSGGTGKIPFQNIGYAVESDGKLLYTTGGLVWDPSKQSTVGTYAIPFVFQSSSVVPDDSLGRTFFLNTFSQYNQYQATSIDAYDQNSFALTGTVPFLAPSVYGPNAVTLARWGSDGFAFVVGDFTSATGSGQVILFRSSIAHATSGSNPVPVATSLGSSSVTAGGPGFMLSVEGASFVPGSVIKWDGHERTTNLLSTTQLTAYIPASDIAQPGTVQITVVNPTPGGGSSLSLPLIVAPAPALASFQPGLLTFGSETVGTQSTAQTVTLQNAGGSALAVSGIQASGDFTEANNCPGSLPPLASCTISVTFTPSATGARQGTLAVTDNAANGPQTVALSGTGTAPSFSFGAGSSNISTATVTSGQTAAYSLSIVSGTNSSGAVALSCTQVPPNATCSVSPSSLTLSRASAASFTVKVTTGVSRSAALLTHLPIATAACGFVWILGLPWFLRRAKTRLSSTGTFCLMLLGLASVAITVGLVGCGGGSSSPAIAPSTTPSGTYTLQIVATEGAVSSSQPITLVVQ